MRSGNTDRSASIKPAAQQSSCNAPYYPTSTHPHIPISAAQQRNGVLNGAADAVLSCIVNVCIGLFLEALMKKAASSLPTYLSPAGRGPSKCCRLLISSTPSEAIYRMATHTALMLLLTIKNVMKCAVFPHCCGSPFRTNAGFSARPNRDPA
ncbi:hypothetical protein [Xylella fastidiosa]|uniref:hypothetical protein n=1 Tax=Xylella fastidiosa TaxID=2371 RepID=UPI00177CB332|nr:hypothetical protein [Xylella fastidiosa]MBE0270029.1 hypothetical protein [Xylella fastidiosa subsp. fastidiosa]